MGLKVVKGNSLIVASMILIALSGIASLIALNIANRNVNIVEGIGKLLNTTRTPLSILVDHSVNVTWIYNYGDREIPIIRIVPSKFKLIELPSMTVSSKIKPKTIYMVNSTKFIMIVKFNGVKVIRVEG